MDLSQRTDIPPVSILREGEERCVSAVNSRTTQHAQRRRYFLAVIFVSQDSSPSALAFKIMFPAWPGFARTTTRASPL